MSTIDLFSVICCRWLFQELEVINNAQAILKRAIRECETQIKYVASSARTLLLAKVLLLCRAESETRTYLLMVACSSYIGTTTFALT